MASANGEPSSRKYLGGGGGTTQGKGKDATCVELRYYITKKMGSKRRHLIRRPLSTVSLR